MGLLLPLGSFVSACGDGTGETGRDARVRDDAGVGLDGSPPADGGPAADGAVASDGSTTSDASVPVDAGGGDPGTCGAPLPLMFDESGHAFEVGMLEGESRQSAPDCPSGGPEVVYTFRTPEPRNLAVNLETDGSVMPSLYLRGPDCEDGAVVECDSGSTGAASLNIHALAAGVHHLVVDGGAAGATGSYSLTAVLEAGGDGESCAGPALIELSDGLRGTGSIEGDFAGTEHHFECGGDGGDLVYTFTAAAGTEYDIDFQTDGRAYWYLNRSELGQECTTSPSLGCSGPSFEGGGGGAGGSVGERSTFWFWVTYASGATTFRIDVSIM